MLPSDKDSIDLTFLGWLSLLKKWMHSTHFFCNLPNQVKENFVVEDWNTTNYL